MPIPADHTRLRLLCPGLFAPADFLAGPEVPTPVLDRLLARADPGAAGGCDPLETLAAAFGLPATVDRDLPLAALTLLAEAPELAGSGCWFHADPVHLRPDRDRLLLFAGPGLALAPAESAALVAAFNAHFASDGLHLVAPRPGAWYLRVAAPPRLRTHPLHTVTGRPLAAFLPAGPDARSWNRWHNEAQMLFFQHPVNRERERTGRATVNGVWTWGGGVLPPVVGGPRLTVADHPLARGLARAADGCALGLAELPLVRRAASGRGFDPAPGAAPVGAPGPLTADLVVFWDALWWPALSGDALAWRAALPDLEALAAGLWAGLASGAIATLSLDAGTGATLALGPGARLRVWRRRGGLRERLRPDPEPDHHRGTGSGRSGPGSTAAP